MAPHDPERMLRALLKRTWIMANTMLVKETTRDLCFVRDHLSLHRELRLDDRQRAFLSALIDYACKQRQSKIASLSESIVQSA